MDFSFVIPCYMLLLADLKKISLSFFGLLTDGPDMRSAEKAASVQARWSSLH